MGYDKLIEASLKILDLCMNAAATIKTLRAENEKLKGKVEDARLEGYVKGVGEINADLARVTAERDAAIEDLLDAAITPCSYCKQNPNNGGACDMDNDNHEMFSCWEWRGIEED